MILRCSAASTFQGYIFSEFKLLRKVLRILFRKLSCSNRLAQTFVPQVL
jgi:hypothetical protein